MITATKDGNYFSVVVNKTTEYRFDSQEERKMFIVGYDRGLAGKELLSHTKPYRLGYQVSSNERKGK